MNINKGKISNLNKKLIATALTLTLAIPLVGCDDVERSYGLNYTTSAEGQCIYQNATFDSMKNYKVVIFECDGEYSTYLTRVVSYTRAMLGGWGDATYYYNAFGGQLLYWSDYEGATSSSVLTIKKEYDFIDYVIINNQVQPEYTEQELKDILEQIKLDYESQKDKQLVKE